MTRIESVTNPLVKRIRGLAQRKAREAEGAFVVEGIQQVWQAVDGGAEIDTLIVAPALLTSVPARAMVERERARGTHVAELSDAVFARIASREHPSGLAAIVRMAHHDLRALSVQPDSLFVALHEIGNPGNLGTILRTLDAVGGAGVVLIGDTTDPYHPTAVRASVGTLFRMPVARASSADDLFAWCRERGIAVVTTSEHAATEFWSATYPSPLMILFGSEGRGLASGDIARGDLAVRIPMRGSAGSLNLAVAAGVLLYEIARQRDGSSR